MEALPEIRTVLGESPLWCPEECALYLVDIKSPRLIRYELSSGAVRSWAMPSEIGGICKSESGKLIVTMRTGIKLFDQVSQELVELAHPERERPRYRLNETKVDPQGRLWVGSVEDPGYAPEGRLYRIDDKGAVCVMQTNLSIPNSLGWNLDGTIMYFADSPRRDIWAYDFDGVTGELASRTVFATVPAGEGLPDGLALDADGFLWSAQIDGARLTRYRPDGKVDQVVQLPVSRPTSIAFGGKDFSTLFITTATLRLSEEELANQPLAGRVLVYSPGVRGLPQRNLKIPDNWRLDRLR